MPASEAGAAEFGTGFSSGKLIENVWDDLLSLTVVWASASRGCGIIPVWERPILATHCRGLTSPNSRPAESSRPLHYR
jgi:hypothetical protein